MQRVIDRAVVERLRVQQVIKLQHRLALEAVIEMQLGGVFLRADRDRLAQGIQDRTACVIAREIAFGISAVFEEIGFAEHQRTRKDRRKWPGCFGRGIVPGLTGLWQVSGRSKIRDFDQVVQLDREYIENWSLKLDWQILAKTVITVITRRGAM